MSGLGIHDLALFAFTVLVLNATPGVDMLYTVSRTMTCGWRGGLAASLGISAGCVVHALLAAFGLAALLAVSGWAFSLIKWAGAAYLVWLGLGMLRDAFRRGEPASTATPPVAVSAWAVFRQGLLTVSGEYGRLPRLPATPGLEIAGHVVALGEGVTRWKTGDEVCALVPGGGYAEYCIASADNCLPVPKGMTLTEAAALPETYFTVWEHCACE